MISTVSTALEDGGLQYQPRRDRTRGRSRAEALLQRRVDRRKTLAIFPRNRLKQMGHRRQAEHLVVLSVYRPAARADRVVGSAGNSLGVHAE